MRVLVVDDHPVVLTGLAALLADESWVGQLDTATTVAAAVQHARAHPPQLAVIDLRLPDGDGVDLLRTLVALVPGLRAVMLTMHADADAAMRALASGAVGYVLKDSPPDEMRVALASAARGGLVVDPAVALPVRRRLGGAGRALPVLPPRQEEMLDLLAAGLPTGVIAERMSLSAKTVRNRLSEVFAALGVTTRAEAIVLARESGLGRGTRQG
jgi:two-component system nitrate/nitrite response regulator NarL